MTWILFALGAAFSWGMYGPILHKGQVQLGNPLRALLCVGLAYFLVGVLVPAISLGSPGQLRGFNSGGMTNSIIGGALGAVGAICIIWSFRNGGTPTYVMPIVFGLFAIDQRDLHDVSASTESRPESALVFGIRSRVGGRRTRAVFQTAVVF